MRMVGYCSDNRRLLGYFQRERESEEKRKRRDWRFKDRLEMQSDEGRGRESSGKAISWLAWKCEAGWQDGKSSRGCCWTGINDQFAGSG